MFLSDEIEIKNQRGLHASAASLIASVAKKTENGIYIIYQDKMADAKDLLEIISLCCFMGEKIKISFEKKKDEEISKEIEKLINNKFGEK